MSFLMMAEAVTAAWGGTLLGAAALHKLGWDTFGGIVGSIAGLVFFYAVGDWLVGFNQALLG